ncbi:MAG: DNA-formamidopyrimidine glycosylase [Erysipelotrichaceae bacterium]|nr:DNA-formamidopyrimidine glycosylase [Erysipelotrichaceae bacterium]MDY5251749.1 DNA-formamidopyrimidine glycosylase [Erysipelotrichaceae bacterium]
MPELPEVETVLRTLEHQIKDQQITAIDVLYEPIVQDKEKFVASLLNQHFRNFLRRGKFLIFQMDDCYFVSHLRMEGKYFIQDTSEPITKHMHVIFTLSNGKQLRYHDTRKFGRMEIWPLDADLNNFHDLGVEPLTPQLNFAYLKAILNKSKHTIKQDLLDQHIIAGIGNIYADEICYFAKIDPSTRSDHLDDKTIQLIVDGTKEILKAAIAAGGTTIRSYTSSLGVTGRFQLSCQVHQKAGQPCAACHTTIQKKVVAGRGTYYCPNCQKEL